MSPTHSISALRRRFDRAALPQLRAAVERLATDNDDMRIRLAAAEQNAEFWSREATEMHLQLCEMQAGKPGITMGGSLVVVQS